jgi:histidyl-tRNA synthetase
MSFKPGIPKGTRDFSPAVMEKRNYVINKIRQVFEKYSFEPIETPAMEQLSVLTGKYGDEGDQLIYKVLNSGDFLNGVSNHDVQAGSGQLSGKIAEKGLRYDLTVPFARYVVMNRNDITFPFRRYQIQPVWRADRPQKGRYREFYQCDADIIGTPSILNEAELVQLIVEVFSELSIDQYKLRINNRKILSGLSKYIDEPEKATALFVAIDKLDKIGISGVKKELEKADFQENSITRIEQILLLDGSADELMVYLKEIFSGIGDGEKGIQEMLELKSYLTNLGIDPKYWTFDLTLARGLSYYTGCIFEVTIPNSGVGSVSGGGRYDSLTGVFGMEGVSGVGISFGIDRLVDAMEHLDLFPDQARKQVDVLIANFDSSLHAHYLKMMAELRNIGFKVILYPDQVKMKKQFSFADQKQVSYVLICGEDEYAKNIFAVKDLASGEQRNFTLEEFINQVKPS